MSEKTTTKPFWTTFLSSATAVIKGIITTPKELEQLKKDNSVLSEQCKQCYALVYDLTKENKELKERMLDMATKGHVSLLQKHLEKVNQENSAKMMLEIIALEERIQLVESVLVDGICSELYTETDDEPLDIDEETQKEIDEVQKLEAEAKPKKHRTRKLNK